MLLWAVMKNKREIIDIMIKLMDFELQLIFIIYKIMVIMVIFIRGIITVEGKRMCKREWIVFL